MSHVQIFLRGWTILPSDGEFGQDTIRRMQGNVISDCLEQISISAATRQA